MKKFQKVGKPVSAAMIAQLLKGAEMNFNCRRIRRSGWIRIPAVMEYRHVIGEFNALLKRIGIKYRMKGKTKIKMHKINRLNRYMAHQIDRLRKAKTNPKLFWTIALRCIQHSIAFRFSALHKIYPSWHTTLAMSEVIKINRKVNHIVQEWDPVLKFHRVYIPKPGNKWRPLGVPTPEWRIALHMWNNMLQLFLEDKLLDTQHGFIVGRGTLTAWREIFAKIIKAKYIYECDLEQFFPSVDLKRISEVLTEYKVPPPIVEYLELINLNAPKLPAEELLDERVYKAKQILNEEESSEGWEMLEAIKFARSKGYGMIYESFDPLNQTNKGDVYSKELSAGDIIGGWESWNLDEEDRDLYEKVFQGVPQGAPTSPLLSILILKDFLSNQDCTVESISYADDPIFYSNKDFAIQDYQEYGIKINQDKSGWIKRDGKWLKPLKYLGLTYDGTTKTLYGTPRNGPISQIPRELQTLWQSISYGAKDNYVADIAKRNFFGFVQAALYTNNWKNLQVSVTKEYLEARNQKVHKKSLFGKYMKSNLSSTIAMNHLLSVFEYEKHRQKLLRLRLNFQYEATGKSGKTRPQTQRELLHEEFGGFIKKKQPVKGGREETKAQNSGGRANQIKHLTKDYTNGYLTTVQEVTLEGECLSTREWRLSDYKKGNRGEHSSLIQHPK